MRRLEGADPMDPKGDLLGHRYRLESVLAGGGMGRVWRAHDTRLQRPVAVKILRSELTGDPAFLSRFRAEAQQAALLNHPHIAAVHDYGEAVREEERLAYLVMELVEGATLSDLLARSGRLDVPRTLRIVRQMASALAVAHSSGVVHGDVKPGNVLLTVDGDVKITDFGIAWSASSVPLTRTGQVIGTAHYLSRSRRRAPRPHRPATSTPSASWPTSAWPAGGRSRARARCRSHSSRSASRCRRSRRTFRGTSGGSWSAPWPRPHRALRGRRGVPGRRGCRGCGAGDPVPGRRAAGDAGPGRRPAPT